MHTGLTRRSIMKAKPSVKVIKREERARQKESADAALASGETAGASAPDIGNTVTSWVREFRQRQREQSKTAFAKLFREAARLPAKA
jgi:hypothetical protein